LIKHSGKVVRIFYRNITPPDLPLPQGEEEPMVMGAVFPPLEVRGVRWSYEDRTKCSDTEATAKGSSVFSA